MRSLPVVIWFRSEKGRLTVHVKDDAVGAAVRVLDLKQSWPALGGHLLRRGPVITRNEDQLGLGTGLPDSSDDGLHAVGPLVNVGHVMWL